jgi:hypothetical protein
LTGSLSLGRRRGGEWANMWHWTELLQSSFQRGSSSSPQILKRFLPHRIPRGGFY